MSAPRLHRAYASSRSRSGRGSARFVLSVLTALLLCAPAAAHADPQTHALLLQASDDLDAWDIDGAQGLLQQLEARAPGAAETAWLRGRVLFENGDYDAAAKAFESAKSLGASFSSLEEDLRLAKATAEVVRGAPVVESEHFTLRAKAEKDRLLAPYAFDALEKAYAALTADLGYQPAHKIRVEIYDSAETLAKVSPLTVQDIKGSGTIALCKYNRLMVTTPRALVRGYPWLDTVSHEFVHFLVTHKGRNTVPIWLQEGLAKFLETRWRGEPGKAIEPMQAQLLLDAAKKNELVTFAEMHPSMAKLHPQERAALAFAEVEAAMRLLYQRGGQQALSELVAAMAAGFSDERAVAQAYGKSFAQFEADWRAEIARPRPSSEPLAKGERPHLKHELVFKDDPKARAKAGGPAGDDGPSPDVKDPAAKKSLRLGELFFARGRWLAAIDEYGKAKARMQDVHEENETLLRRYAFALMQEKRAPEAVESLQRAVKIDRDDSGAQVLLANALLLTGQPQPALAALQAAVEIDPFDIRVHQLWEDAAARLHDTAVQERERAAVAVLYGRTPSGQSAPPSSSPGDGAASSQQSKDAR